MRQKKGKKDNSQKKLQKKIVKKTSDTTKTVKAEKNKKDKTVKVDSHKRKKDKKALNIESVLSQDKVIQKEIKKLLSAASPEKYIDISVKVNISSSLKGVITRLWLEKSGFTIQDIKYARNRHPYWKSKKQKNHSERTRKRFDEFNFSNGTSKKWSRDELREFIKLNDKMTDKELASYFQRSIPAIQGIRRRINLGNKILSAQGNGSTKKSSLLKYVTVDEKVLRRELAKINEP